MSQTEQSGAVIELQEAQEMITNFKNKFPDEIKASLIDASLVKSLLAQEDCVGVRIYNGYNLESNKLSPVMVGVNSKNEDMSGGIILDRMSPCPDYCPSATDFI